MSEETIEQEDKTSKDEYAELVVGKRPLNRGVLFYQPCELGYHCPVCKYENVTDGEFDERLHFSEYNGFLWCQECNKDYPSTICQPDPEKATMTFLSCVWEARKKLSFNKEVIENIISELVVQEKNIDAEELIKALEVLEKHYKLGYDV